MKLADLKRLAETFRQSADNQTATRQLADDAIAAHPNDTEVRTLCDSLKAAADGAAVRAILDEVKVRA